MTYLQTFCAWCGGELPHNPGRGRRRRYCRASHRQRAYEARAAAQRHHLGPDDVIISRSGWEAMRTAVVRLREVSSQAAAELAAGRDPSGAVAASVGALSAAVATLQEASDPKAAW